MYFIFPVKHINDVVKKQLSSCTFQCNGNVPKFHQKFYSFFIRRGFSSCLSSISQMNELNLIRIENTSTCLPYLQILTRSFSITSSTIHHINFSICYLPGMKKLTILGMHLQIDITKHFFRACVDYIGSFPVLNFLTF